MFPESLHLDAIVAALEGRREGASHRCRCPVHGGRSLIVTEKDRKLLVSCKAGCSQDAVIDALRELGVWPSSEGRVHQVQRAPNSFQKPEDATGTLAERGILPATQQRFGLTEDAQLVRFPIIAPDGRADGVKARRKHPQSGEGRYSWLSPTSSALIATGPRFASAEDILLASSTL